MFFFFNDTATTEIYTLSLHDALPIFAPDRVQVGRVRLHPAPDDLDVVLVPGVVEGVGLRHPDDEAALDVGGLGQRSEEHTSELQSRQYLVCRLLLEKKKTHIQTHHTT